MKTPKSYVNRKSKFFHNQVTFKEESRMRKSRILALVLVFVLCFSSIAMANDDFGPVLAPDEDNPVQVAITKILRLPIGTTTPNVTFNFTARKISFENSTSDEALAVMPTLNPANLTISFTAANTTEPDANNIMSIPLETGDLFFEVDFPRAGVYIYEITENPRTNDLIDFNTPYETLTYSDAIYTLRVYVANTEDYTGTYVFAVGAIITRPDNGNQTVNFKVDPTPGGDDINYNHSQMIFTNDYVKTNAPEDPDKPDPITESTLNVSKTVTGDLGDRGLYFSFDMTLTIPILVEDIPLYYPAYVVEGTRVIGGEELLLNASASQIGTDDGGLNFINISSRDITSFRLKHGQRLVFVNTPVGTRYTVTEAAAVGYVSSVEIRADLTVVDTVANTLPNLPVLTGYRFVGEWINTAAFENNRTTIVPTGLNINDLPFVGMIAFPVIFLLGYVALKSRKRNNAIPNYNRKHV